MGLAENDVPNVLNYMPNKLKQVPNNFQPQTPPKKFPHLFCDFLPHNQQEKRNFVPRKSARCANSLNCKQHYPIYI
jgi:hypothetical protein